MSGHYEMTIEAKDAITLCLASVGAVLGVINTWKALDRDRAKLKVIPKHAIPFGDADPRLRFGIEVINLGTFALTVREVGVLYYGVQHRGAIVRPILLDGGPWPRRLEPRTAVSVYSQGLPSQDGRVRCAYAMTDCDLMFEGSSPALEQMSRELSG